MLGEETIDADFKAFLNTLIYEIVDALNVTMDEAKDILQEHIKKDVYGAYTPTVYKRRSQDGSLGTPLSDVNTYGKIIAPSGGNVGGNLEIKTSLFYNPMGTHSKKKWSEIDRDLLIGRIEKKDPPYSWGNNKVPERPFWQNFITEMEGSLENIFVREMQAKEEIVADGGLVADEADRNY